MRKRFGSQVHPSVAALAILIVLAVVQYFWWMGLVAKKRGIPGPPNSAGGGAPSPAMVFGRKDVAVGTLAGATDPGDTDGSGRIARFDGPTGIALDPRGGIVVADTRNNRIRHVATDGWTSTIAGGKPGCIDGPISVARFDSPCGVAVSPDGVVYVADTGNHRVRRIKDGQVTTVAGGGPGHADGVGSSARFSYPCGVAVGPGGVLFVSDVGNRRLRTISAAGVVGEGVALPAPPAAVTAEIGAAVAVPAASTFWIGGAPVLGIRIELGDQAGLRGAESIKLKRPIAVCRAPDGWYLVDEQHAAVLHISGTTADVVAGVCVGAGPQIGWRDGTGDRCSFGAIGGIIADAHGHIYVSDTGNNMIRVLSLPSESSVNDGRTLP